MPFSTPFASWETAAPPATRRLTVALDWDHPRPGRGPSSSAGRRRLIRVATALNRAATLVAQPASVPNQAPNPQERTACRGCSDYELLHGRVLSFSRDPTPSSGRGSCPRTRTSLRSWYSSAERAPSAKRRSRIAGADIAVHAPSVRDRQTDQSHRSHRQSSLVEPAVVRVAADASVLP